jgi:hypothetical protein
VRRASTRKICSENQMAAQSNHPRADWEANEKHRPRLYTGKDEEEDY